MNVIGKSFEKYCIWIDHWSASQFSFILQAVLLFGLPTLLCFLVFQCGSRSVGGQSLFLVIGMLLAGTIPVEKIKIPNPLIKAWVLTICVLALAFLPGVLPTLITPTLGAQRKLRIGFWLLLAGLFLSNLLMGRDQ